MRTDTYLIYVKTEVPDGSKLKGVPRRFDVYDGCCPCKFKLTRSQLLGYCRARHL
jgi:hypothetical protein